MSRLHKSIENIRNDVFELKTINNNIFNSNIYDVIQLCFCSNKVLCSIVIHHQVIGVKKLQINTGGSKEEMLFS